jgi:hypothetical protein
LLRSIWGIEGNYPGEDNSYFLEVADELIEEALSAAKNKLKELSRNDEETSPSP